MNSGQCFGDGPCHLSTLALNRAARSGSDPIIKLEHHGSYTYEADPTTVYHTLEQLAPATAG